MDEAMQRVLARFEGNARSGDNYKVFCPIHNDLSPSLEIGPGKGGRVLLRCHAGCKIEDIMKAVSPPITWGELMGDGRPVEGVRAGPRARQVTEEDRVLRDKVYRAMSLHLGLRDDHRTLLRARGLTDDQIGQDLYATMGPIQKARAVRELLKEYPPEDLNKVPGWSVTGDGAVSLSSVTGILIPALDVQGRVTACQVRTGEPGRKYVWLSGPEVSSGTPPHVTKSWPVREVIVTEGPLKANLVFWRWPGEELAVVGVPGAANWRDALPAIRELKAARTLIGYDQDWKTKPVVRAQLDALTVALRAEGRAVKWLEWDGSRAKGLDDALLAGLAITKIEPLLLDEFPAENLTATGDPGAGDVGALVAESHNDRAHPETLDWVVNQWMPKMVWLVNRLARGPASAAVVLEEAEARFGWTEKQMKAVKAAAGVRSQKVKGGWEWRLAEDEARTRGTETS